MKRREEDSFKKEIEQQKLSALVEQKLELTEQELKDYKQKWALKEAEVKELNKELMAGKKELLQFSDKLRITEKMHADELAQVKAECD